MPYWKIHRVPHSIDVMHITKNVCESLLGALLNMPERTKDGPFERMNDVIKGYVLNMSCPEGSIAKGFPTEECISNCTNYLGIKNPVGLPVNKHLGRLAGWGHREGRREMHVDFKGRLANFERANLVTLNT